MVIDGFKFVSGMISMYLRGNLVKLVKWFNFVE